MSGMFWSWKGERIFQLRQEQMSPTGFIALHLAFLQRRDIGQNGSCHLQIL